MDVAALSAVMAHRQVHQQVSVSVAAKVKDNVEASGQNLIRMMEQSVTPNLGKSIDLRL